MGALIPDGSQVLLDTVAIIYFLEHDGPRQQLAADILTRIEQGKLKGVISSLALTELLVPTYRAGDTSQARKLANLLRNFHNLEMVPLTDEIAMEAARLRAMHGLRTPDAIHAATAMACKADGILTNDKRLRRMEREGLSVWLFDAA